MKPSTGILLYRWRHGAIEVLIGHPGGPFWEHKDAGAWSIPKGQFEEGESPLAAAKREFAEETGLAAPEGTLMSLGSAKQPSGKVISVWAAEGDADLRTLPGSNTFEMEWPPKSGAVQHFPEIDRLAWEPLVQAAAKLSAGQRVFLERLAQKLGSQPDTTS